MARAAVGVAATLALFAGLLIHKQVAAQTKELDLKLERERVFDGDEEPFCQMTCRAEINAVNLDTLAMIWVKGTGESIELLKVKESDDGNSFSVEEISGHSKIETNRWQIVVSRMNAEICDSSYFLCEAISINSCGKPKRAIATAWPSVSQTDQSDASTDPAVVSALGRKLADATALLQMFNMSFQNLLANREAERDERSQILERLSELEQKASSTASPESTCGCETITNKLDSLESRLAKLENQTRAEATQTPITVCERGMNELTNEPYVLMVLDTLGTQIRCDAQTDGGGWIVIQRRTNADVDFNKAWNEYRNGFGDLSGNFWLGNDAISKLTAGPSARADHSSPISPITVLVAW
ncbi:angiopoietin-4 [Elysia marginata]|uniref:Angiopoietin-4 n=1 Tax=Elysia marginata TaxID=1093978 RepID=A0AAV4FZ36_9GAST|nr:angiopoietin-4 [Elysia marginata]